MSSDEIAISVRNLSKEYKIDQRRKESSFAEAMLSFARNPFRNTPKEIVSSLKDVTFDVPRGEIVGVVGKNGAGKSTLLKLLSRITEPTSGEITFRGRMGSLIEVGTGFQPELTGRENIFLNGAILGMTRREIAQRFDEIVAFSGVERYLDTPVKRYSSGMYVRLAFAVAAHLDTEILLVDEVLAVGDADFQKKSLQKMGDVAKSGRTILFVSHNTATIEALCTSALLLRAGELVRSGNVGDIINEYHRMALATGTDGADASSRNDFGKRYKYFRNADLLDGNGHSARIFQIGSSIVVDYEVESAEELTLPTLVIYIDSVVGQNFVTLKSPCNASAIRRIGGRVRVQCVVESLPIIPGEYYINLALRSGGGELESIETGLQFTMVNADMFNNGWGAHDSGLCMVNSEWMVREM